MCSGLSEYDSTRAASRDRLAIATRSSRRCGYLEGSPGGFMHMSVPVRVLYMGAAPPR
ncbi:hypothetical protein EXIGLDRAFT_719963 [Exidia glandulosa HHB12029]|uniref:Uncharacterized protein n=1 Tax=Exidia glandulosa HHB12029 TaxID=1314781 RepID=A0A165NKT3_EXIGL|nr:hypothetical protein EXIGLDRAFT_719963 [Exidia glandulosa HHB12029]